MKRFLKNNLFVVYVMLWIALAVIHFFLLTRTWQIDFSAAALDSLVFNGLFTVIGIGLWFWTKYSDLIRRRAFELFINHLTGCTISLFIWLAAGYQILSFLLYDDAGYLGFLESSLMVRAISGIFYYLLLALCFYLITGYRELNEKTGREKKLYTLLRDSELNMLRSQIKPHFLFNSLNSINSLILSKPEKAREMVIKLSEFMRYSLSQQDESMIALEKELHHLGLYLEIEKVRFADRLRFDQDICDDCFQQKIPAMILQPLIENAVKHGVYESTDTVQIRLSAKMDQNSMVIVVENNFDPEYISRKGTGTGLKNITSRLQMLYGRPDLIKISQQGNLFLVELKFPL